MTSPSYVPAREGEELEQAALLKQDGYTARLLVRVGSAMHLIPTSSVDWFEAAGNYVRLHVGAKTYDMRGTMRALLRRLDPRQFQRIHRSTIVNLSRIQEIRRWTNGDSLILLQDGQELRLSRAHRKQLLATIG
jgi:two-component system LytT family response regulator